MPTPLSLNKSKACATCTPPNSCIHSVTLETTASKASMSVYKQDNMLKDIVILDKAGEGVLTSVTLVSKGCVTGNPSCPSGVLYRKGEALKEIKVGKNDYVLKFPTVNSKAKASIHFVEFLDACVLGSMKVLPHVEYYLSISECRGKGSLEEFYEKYISSLFSCSPNPRASIATKSSILIYPKMEWSAKAVLVLEAKRVEEESNKKRKKRNSKRSSVKKLCNVKITCDSSLTVADQTQKYTKEIANKDFRVKGHTSKLLSRLCKAQKISSALGTSSGKEEYPIHTSKFTLPTVTIDGTGSLELSKDDEPFIKSETNLTIDNLLNYYLKIDLIEAFAKRYHVKAAIDGVRSELAKLESKTKDDTQKECAAYLGADFNIEFKSIINAHCTINATEVTPWSVDIKSSKEVKEQPNGGKIEGFIDLLATVNVRFGAKINVLEGLFEGKITASATATLNAKACATIERGIAETVELILHHNGIWAKVVIDWEAVRRFEAKSRDNDVGAIEEDITSPESGLNTSTYKDTKQYDWEIYPACPKNKSNFRVDLVSSTDSKINFSHLYSISPGI